VKALVAVILVAALAAVPAQAAAPPRGTYECVIGANSILFGNLVIKGAGKYAHRGTKGTFTSSGKKLRFKGGDLKGMRGRWYRTTDGKVEIALRNPRDDFESIYCDRI
jgi:hypothetical protein